MSKKPILCRNSYNVAHRPYMVVCHPEAMLSAMVLVRKRSFCPILLTHASPGLVPTSPASATALGLGILEQRSQAGIQLLWSSPGIVLDLDGGKVAMRQQGVDNRHMSIGRPACGIVERRSSTSVTSVDDDVRIFEKGDDLLGIPKVRGEVQGCLVVGVSSVDGRASTKQELHDRSLAHERPGTRFAPHSGMKRRVGGPVNSHIGTCAVPKQEIQDPVRFLTTVGSMEGASNEVNERRCVLGMHGVGVGAFLEKHGGHRRIVNEVDGPIGGRGSHVDVLSIAHTQERSDDIRVIFLDGIEQHSASTAIGDPVIGTALEQIGRAHV